MRQMRAARKRASKIRPADKVCSSSRFFHDHPTTAGFRVGYTLLSLLIKNIFSRLRDIAALIGPMLLPHKREIHRSSRESKCVGLVDAIVLLVVLHAHSTQSRHLRSRFHRRTVSGRSASRSSRVYSQSRLGADNGIRRRRRKRLEGFASSMERTMGGHPSPTHPRPSYPGHRPRRSLSSSLSEDPVNNRRTERYAHQSPRSF